MPEARPTGFRSCRSRTGSSSAAAAGSCGDSCRRFAGCVRAGVLVATAVLAESAAALVNALAPHRCELLTVNISRGEPLGGQTLLRAENPITIAVYRKPEKETRLS